jgi:hypothetical protein
MACVVVRASLVLLFATGCLSDPPFPYQATAVHFDGSDYLMQPGLMYAPTDSQVGVTSVWLRFEEGDAQEQTILSVNGYPTFSRGTDNKLALAVGGCANGLFSVTTQGTYTMASGWIHVMAAWDLGNGTLQFYVNDKPDLAIVYGPNSGPICYYSSNWYIGSTGSGAYLDADVADLSADFTTFSDLDDPSNRARFRNAYGKPVDPGPNCASAYNGTMPNLCFTGSASTWYTNQGTGGGFTPIGQAPSPATTSPSD